MTPLVPAAPAPPDAQERDRVLHQLDRTLFVEAGAGTGKTTALVGRIRALVSSGDAELRHIAAITFTEAAAAQLRDRVRAALESALRDPDMDADARERCASALEQVDEAGMLTLHGFAQQLLAEHPLQAGLPPTFEIMDELAEAEWLEAAWEPLLDELLEQPGPAACLRTLLALDVSLSTVRTVALAMARAYDRVTDAAALPAPPAATGLDAWIADLAVVDEWLGWCTVEDALSDHLRRLSALRQRLPHEHHDEQLRLLAVCRMRCRSGQAANWGGRAAEIREALRDLDDRRQAVLRACGAAALAPVLAHLRDWALSLARQRAQQGTLTFHDLLVHARDLLLHQPEVRADALRRWRRLLIDEFQDTDPLQAEIALALAGERLGDVEAGRLFFVGDPKQSIYRFRRADIALYNQLRERFEDGLVRLSTSFRSLPEPVGWVNALFAQPLNGADGQAPFHELTPVRAAGQDSSVRVLGQGHADIDTATLRQREADDVAQLIVEARAAGWQVGDAGARRTVRYADIAVLLPTRTTLAGLERALERQGVPYRVEASSLVFSSEEVRELIALLRAVDDPTDDIAIISALRSPGLACPDDALARWRQDGHGWDYRVPVEAGPAHPEVTAALAQLRTWHDLRRFTDPAALLDLMVRELRLMALALARPRPRDSWRRLRFVLDHARAFAESGGGLRELVRRLERFADEDVRVTEQVLPDEDDDAVRILTVHAAKGLEFPVVILAGLGVRPRAGVGPLLWDQQGGLHARVGVCAETPGYEAAKQQEQLAQAQEQVRLLYVAATRARDHLALSVHHRIAGPAAAPTMAQFVAELLPRAEGLWRQWQPQALRPAAGPGEALHGWHGDPDGWRRQRDAALARGLRAPVISATALAGDGGVLDAAADEPPAQPGEPDRLPPFRRGRAGTALGRAVHAVLQTVDLAAGQAAAITAAARAQAEAEGIADRAGEITARVTAALRSEPVREAVASGMWWREVPVAAAVHGGMVEGFLDLVYRDADGDLVLIDYKTDEQVDDHISERYRLQLGAYVLALQTALRRPVARAGLLFARPDGAAVRWLDQPAEAARDAQARAQRRFAAGR